MSSASDDDDDDAFFDTFDSESAHHPELSSTLVAASSADVHGADQLSSRAGTSRLQELRYTPSDEEPVPRIPDHFLQTGHPAPVSPRAPTHNDTTRRFPRSRRPPTVGGAERDPSQAHTCETLREHGGHLSQDTAMRAGDSGAAETRSKRVSHSLEPAKPTAYANSSALSKLEGNSASDEASDMARAMRKSRDVDLFLEVADHAGSDEHEPSWASRVERKAKRASYAGKSSSFYLESPAHETSNPRPSTSGNGSVQPKSRGTTSEIQRHVDRYRKTPSRSFQADDTQSVSARSRAGRTSRYFAMPERSPLSPSRLGERVTSPELSQYGRRRPSLGALSSRPRPGNSEHFLTKLPQSQEESPAESSETKQTDSASADSQTADTVWDELDDLKSRIKRLELTGKMPTSSSAAISGDFSDRPRTATTAPTTIDSSPKHERKPDLEAEQRTTPQAENASSGTGAANIHPLLHSALAKAKPLLHGSLYRMLEATASDALQLAAMTGITGPQGTAYSAASIINHATTPDRHIRRKADNMCRNLTDLCLALCEGKHESAVTTPSNMTLEVPTRDSPMSKYPRNSLSPGINSTTRPMSRLAARKSSFFDTETANARASTEDVSASEQEPAASSFDSKEPKRIGRVSSGLFRTRLARQDVNVEDDDPTLRPPSRAMTEIGGLRSRLGANTHSSGQQRAPSLRESIPDLSGGRRSNETSFENNRKLSRVSSFGSEAKRRRFFDRATPPVLEEESPPDEEPTAQPRRRITSFAGQHSSRRAIATTDIAHGRASSLNQRRRVIAE